MSGSTYLTSNFTGTGTSTGDKVTYSVWIKRGDIAGDDRSTIISGHDDGSNYMKLRFADDDKFHIYGVHSGSPNSNVYANKQCRDVNGWYHLVWQIDTTHATESERVKVWINGESISISGTMPSQNHPIYTLKSNDMEIGRNAQSDNEHFDGIMSHFHCCHGYLYAPTTFGSTDATTGEWKINSNPSVSYGTKGWFMFKDDASVTDQSGNGNSFTAGGGGLTKSESNPSNIFATWNSLWSQTTGSVGDVTFSQGNLTTTTTTNYRTTPATLGMSGSGKYYWEVKRLESGDDTHFGVMSENATPANTATWIGNAANGWILAGDNGQPYTGGSSGSAISNTAVGTNGIHMCAYDSSTGKLYFGVNGTWGGTANPSTGANAHYTLDNSLTYFPIVSTGGDVSANFGNGYFGTTAVSSAGTNASNLGIFEYDVPSGFTALCTKGINSF